MSEKHLAQVARQLGASLKAWAKERRDEDKKMIAVLHHELVVAYDEDRAEQLAKESKNR